MSNDVMQAAMTTWAAKDLPARLLSAQVAKLLNCTTDDVSILVSAGKLRALGKPKPNAVKFFSSIELITLLADREWLDEAKAGGCRVIEGETLNRVLLSIGSIGLKLRFTKIPIIHTLPITI